MGETIISKLFLSVHSILLLAGIPLQIPALQEVIDVDKVDNRIYNIAVIISLTIYFINRGVSKWLDFYERKKSIDKKYKEKK